MPSSLKQKIFFGLFVRRFMAITWFSIIFIHICCLPSIFVQDSEQNTGCYRFKLIETLMDWSIIFSIFGKTNMEISEKTKYVYFCLFTFFFFEGSFLCRKSDLFLKLDNWFMYKIWLGWYFVCREFR